MENSTQVWFGHMNPRADKFLESEYQQEEVVAFELNHDIFSVGYELKTLEDKTDPEAAKEAYYEEGYPRNRPSVPWLVDRVDEGDLIVVTPFGKDAELRLLGKVSSGWKYRDDGLWDELDIHNHVEVDQWVIITRDELPEYLQDYSARSTIQNCQPIADNPEDIESLEELHEKRKDLL